MPEIRPTIEDVIEKIVRELANETPVHVTPETDLFADLALDSLTLTSLVVQLEDHYKIMLDEATGGELRTVQHLAALVVRRIGEQW